ncbi:uncharacterized protein SOCE26_021210 [Sorangium cellulosum]|uniref:PEGA domain-containing protein n=1 Tax=Sorangium cellulosum TaxID=56 RepID=A0A2L0EN63_SORCE|nr:tetratricopeptide repeat protein [Sorangium cellulosum]AUX40720.1 uncharacterized protein SOCE26_021210 [Sorangium cellulosum]
MRYRLLSVGVLLLGALVPAPAIAEETAPTAQSKAAARSLADEGWNLYTAGRYEDALKAFSQAEAKVHAPTVLLMMARANEKLGRLLEARAVYKRIVEEKLAAGAAPAFVQAQASAKEELAALLPRIPTVRVVVRGAASDAVTLTLGGTSVEPSSFVERNPGDHVLVATITGRRPIVRTVNLTEGVREQIVLDIVSGQTDSREEPGAGIRDSAEISSGSRDAGRPLAGRNAPKSSSKPLLYTGMALTGVAAGVGAVFGVMSLKKESDADDLHVALKEQNGDHACALEQNAERCKTLISMREEAVTHTKLTWGFFGGAAVAGAGTLIYYWTASSPSKATASPRVVPHVGAGGGGIVISGAW